MFLYLGVCVFPALEFLDYGKTRSRALSLTGSSSRSRRAFFLPRFECLLRNAHDEQTGRDRALGRPQPSQLCLRYFSPAPVAAPFSLTVVAYFDDTFTTDAGDDLCGGSSERSSGGSSDMCGFARCGYVAVAHAAAPPPGRFDGPGPLPVGQRLLPCSEHRTAPMARFVSPASRYRVGSHGLQCEKQMFRRHCVRLEQPRPESLLRFVTKRSFTTATIATITTRTSTSTSTFEKSREGLRLG